jgi:flagellar biosynthetic protein FliR
MIAELWQLLAATQTMLWVFLAVFIRIGGIMALLPAFGDQAVPMRVRLVLTAMFTLVVAPAVATVIGAPPDNLVQAVPLLGAEVLTGLFFGLFLRFFIHALQIAGAIAAQATSLSQIFGGTTVVDPQPAIGNMLVVAGTALAAVSGLHVKVAAYIIQGYSMFAFGVAPTPAIVAQVGLAEITRIFTLGMTLAVPFLIASTIYNVVLGVINRAMPQLMVSFVGAPALTAGGMLLLLLAAPIMLSVWLAAFSQFIATPFAGPP